MQKALSLPGFAILASPCIAAILSAQEGGPSRMTLERLSQPGAFDVRTFDPPPIVDPPLMLAPKVMTCPLFLYHLEVESRASRSLLAMRLHHGLKNCRSSRSGLRTAIPCPKGITNNE